MSLDDPARAFDALRREVSLALRATQGLSAEHNEQPDYTETLKAMDERLGAITASLQSVEASPAMQLTPGNLSASIAQASIQARAKDSEILRTAHATSTTLIQQLRLAIQQVETAKAQNQQMILAAIGGVLLGILIWSILPGMVVRALPARWAAPEWMAARIMRLDREQAGERLLGVKAVALKPSPSVLPTPAAKPSKPHRSTRH